MCQSETFSADCDLYKETGHCLDTVQDIGHHVVYHYIGTGITLINNKTKSLKFEESVKTHCVPNWYYL